MTYTNDITQVTLAKAAIKGDLSALRLLSYTECFSYTTRCCEYDLCQFGYVQGLLSYDEAEDLYEAYLHFFTAEGRS